QCVLDAGPIGLLRPHSGMPVDQRLDPDQDLNTSGIAQGAKQIGAVSNSPVHLGEITRLRIRQFLQKSITISGAGKGIVIGQFQQWLGPYPGNGIQLPADIGKWLFSERTEQSAGAAKFTRQRTTSLGLQGETRRSTAGQQIKAGNGRLGKAKWRSASVD